MNARKGTPGARLLAGLLAVASSLQLLGCLDARGGSGEPVPDATVSHTVANTSPDAAAAGPSAGSASTANYGDANTTTTEAGTVDHTPESDASNASDASTDSDISISSDASQASDAEISEGAALPGSSPGCSGSSWPKSGAYKIDVDGTTRDYFVTLPDGYTPQRRYRLIFAWHGAGGTAQQMVDSGYYGLQERAAETAIFVAGQGLDFEPIPFIVFSGWSNTDERDTNFARALVGSMGKSYCIDENRIFSVGMSFGGVMTEMIGCGLGDLFRGIAAMSGAGPDPLPADFPLTVPTLTCTGQVAAWISQGDQDPIALPELGAAGRDHWLSANHCKSQGTIDAATGCVSYDGCDPGYPVHWCEFSGGHIIPSFASDAIWNFFSVL